MEDEESVCLGGALVDLIWGVWAMGDDEIGSGGGGGAGWVTESYG